MVDTQGLGAGSYPQAPEEEWNCYFFIAEISGTIRGYVWAKNVEQAEEFIIKNKYDEIEERKEKVEEITNIEKVEAK